MRGVLAAALLVCVSLSGCSGDSEPEGDGGTDVVVVTNPFEALNRTDSRPHLHDYWGGATVLDVMDATVSIGSGLPVPLGGIVAFGGAVVPGAEFRPEPGGVVPQGTAEVVVTFTWTDDAPLNAHGQPELQVKTAADNQPVPVGPLESGVAVSIPTTNEQNDLPHQVLSAWVFMWILPPDDSGTHVAYNGEVQVHVQAVRGLDIPLYPGHPDAWLGRTEIPLLDVEEDVFYDGDPTTGNMRCYGGCPEVHEPAEGVIVPDDAHHVTVTLLVDRAAPTTLGLKYHGADSREFTAPQPDAGSTGTELTYTIPVEGAGDGPYAKQSQWQFVPYVAGPVPDGYVVQDHYRMTAVAHKLP